MPGGYEWIIIIAVVLLLFGAKKLPDMARSIGQSARVFKGEMKGLKEDEATPDQPKPAQGTPTPPEALPTSTATVTPSENTTAATPGETTPQPQPGRSTDVT